MKMEDMLFGPTLSGTSSQEEAADQLEGNEGGGALMHRIKVARSDPTKYVLNVDVPAVPQRKASKSPLRSPKEVVAYVGKAEACHVHSCLIL